MDDQDEGVRRRAYEIWEQRGRPEGEHEYHWRQALEELGLVSPARQSEVTTAPANWDDEE